MISSLTKSDMDALARLFAQCRVPEPLERLISTQPISIASSNMRFMSVRGHVSDEIITEPSPPDASAPTASSAVISGLIQLRFESVDSSIKVTYEWIKIHDIYLPEADTEIVVLDGGIDVSRTLTKADRSALIPSSVKTLEVTVLASDATGNTQWFAISAFETLPTSNEVRQVALFNRGNAKDAELPETGGVERLMAVASATGFFFGGSKLQKALVRHVRSPKRRPIFLIPGILGSRFYSAEDLNDLEWVDVLSFIRPGDLADRLSDPTKTVPRPGRLEDIESLNPHIGKTEVFEPLTQALRGDGLEFGAGLLFGAPYDWRMSPRELSSPGAFFQELKSRIEAAARERGPVVIGTHSMGTNTITSFLLQDTISVAWIQQNVHAVVTGGGPWLGAPKALLAASHGVRLVNFTPIVSATRKMGNRLHSIRTLFPVGDWTSELPQSFVRDSKPYFFMDRSSSTSNTLLDEDALFSEVGGEALEIQLREKSNWYGPEDTGEARLGKFADKMQQAKVKVVCVYGTGTETPLSFILARNSGSTLDVDTSLSSSIDGFTVKNGTVLSGGDGTVPQRSLCPPILAERQDVFEFVDVPSVDHVGIVSSAEYGQYLVSLATE
eukprot:TRINITY_DN13654_c0_g1_i1.p1 TRINITY_DN13654_c0_g1~~TRINITY_DN13654_c0_g1_i1.p1  ORF type:complete len:612 (-),score=85.90 TRINITY_DN13654_c0_g1_i1:164-1999(-)